MTAANLVQSRCDMYVPPIATVFGPGIARDLTGADAPPNAQHLPCEIIVQGPGNLVMNDLNGTTSTIAYPAGSFRLPIAPAELTAACTCTVIAFWEVRVNAKRAFFPSQLSSVSGWLRLAVSQQSGGKWTPSIIDVANSGSPMVQTVAVRQTSVGASLNGLPTMVFSGTNVHLWPQSPAHSATTKVGIWLWYKPATVAGIQRLYTVAAGVSGSATNRLQLYATGDKLQCECYISGVDGRFGTTPAATLVAGAQHPIYLQYDSSRGGDPNLQIWVNGVSQTLVFGNLGAGGALAALPAASGNALVGGGTDSDTPANPIVVGGVIGPNIFALNNNLTASEELALRNFEAPT